MNVHIKGVIIPNDQKWIYDLFEIESVCPKDIIETVNNADGEKIDVYINSKGGDVFSGSEIYTTLINYQGEVSIHIVGIAASAASVIACAGYCDISPTAMIMIHNVSSYAEGDCNIMQHESDVLKKCNKSIAAAYVRKTGKDEKDFLKLMNSETWLTAEQAVEIGLCDCIMQSNNKNFAFAASYNNMIPLKVINKVQNLINGRKIDLQNKINFLKEKKV